MSIELISLAVTVFLAFIGFVAAYWNNLRIAKRQERLELINKRIGEFYGPLYIANQAGARAYRTLVRKLNKKKAVFADETGPPTEKDLAEWRIWLKHVFMPNNEIIENLIMKKAYLIQEEDMPECLLEFITHVSVYKAVLSKWEGGDFTESLSIVDFPTEIGKYASDSYRQLKAKQLKLIGKLK